MTMRSLNRVHNPAHSLKLFQRDIFWPTLESIRDGRGELAALDREEGHLLNAIIDRNSIIGLDNILGAQRDLALRRAEKQAEIERKWTLIHAGCHWIAALLAESDGLADPKLKPGLQPTPELVANVLIHGAKVYADNLEIG